MVDGQLPFRRAEAYELGVTRGELAGPRWRLPHRNRVVPVDGVRESPEQRALDAASVLPPGGALGGWAAAYLLGARELDGRGPRPGNVDPVVLVLPPRRQVTRRPGIEPLRSRLDDGDVVEVAGVRVTSDVRTGFDLARTLSLDEAVACVDVLARGRPDYLRRLGAYASRRLGWRGAPAARRVISLGTARSRSKGESRLRVLWVVKAGLPAPVVNPVVMDDSGVLGMPDLLGVARALVGEYDGSGHRELAAHTDDNAREERFEAAGLLVVRATSLDVRPRWRWTVQRLIDAHERGLASAGVSSWRWRPGPLPIPAIRSSKIECDERQAMSACRDAGLHTRS